MPGGLTADLFFNWPSRTAQGMGTAIPDASRREENIDFWWGTEFNKEKQSNHAIRYTGTLYIERADRYKFYVWIVRKQGFELLVP